LLLTTSKIATGARHAHPRETPVGSHVSGTSTAAEGSSFGLSASSVDIHLRGRDGYSFAEHMAARGFVVIAADPLGVGDSGRPEDGTLCTYDALADAAHGAVQLVRARLTDGTLVAHLPPIAADIEALHVGYTAAHAARVTAPVMVAFGEFDLAERPRDEAAFYDHSDDITLLMLAGSYHCHNFQDGRARLWDRLGAWATEVVTAPELVTSP
jgi:hypothetical protein